MKIRLLTVESAKPPWFLDLANEYEKKNSRFIEFQRVGLRSSGQSREESVKKKKLESDLILSKIQESESLILFDEKGRSLGSREFSKRLSHKFSNESKMITFVIGGAFGVSDSLRQRANEVWKLSDLTLNHLVAQIVALEQIYRALTIWKGTPYHNE